MSKMLKIVFRNRHRNMAKAKGHGGGPQARMDRLKEMVTELFKYERIEEKSFYLDEARGYAELIIMEAINNGDKHKPTMEMLDNWFLEKDMIHKLFKDLVPRYKNYNTCYTNFYFTPLVIPSKGAKQGILELKGNPLPPVISKYPKISKNIINTLVDGVRVENAEKIELKKKELRESSRTFTPHENIHSSIKIKKAD